MIRLQKCPACSSTRHIKLGGLSIERRKRPVDRVDVEAQLLIARIERDQFRRELCMCINCTLLFQNPTYNDFELSKLYAIDHSYKARYSMVVSPVKMNERQRVTERNIKIRQRYYAEKIISFGGTSVLDYGGGTGVNLLHPVLTRFDRYVYDFGRDSKAKDKIIAVKNLDSCTKKFDSILCTHVLEHMTDPVATLKKLRRLINLDGTLYLEIPFEYSERFITRRPGAIWHINYFNRHVIRILAARTGWRCELAQLLLLPYGEYRLNCIAAFLRPNKGKVRKVIFNPMELAKDIICALYNRARYSETW